MADRRITIKCSEQFYRDWWRLKMTAGCESHEAFGWLLLDNYVNDEDELSAMR